MTRAHALSAQTMRMRSGYSPALLHLVGAETASACLILGMNEADRFMLFGGLKTFAFARVAIKGILHSSL